MRNNASLKMHKFKMPKIKKHKPRCLRGSRCPRPRSLVQDQGTKVQDTRSQDTQDQDTYVLDTHAQDTSNQDKFSRSTSPRCTRSRSKTNYCSRPGPSQNRLPVLRDCGALLGLDRPLSMVSFDDFSTFLAPRGVFGIYSEWF